MSQENKTLADRFHLDLFQHGDLAAADELLSPEFAWHGGMAPPPGNPGPVGAKQVASAVVTAFPDRRITHEDIVAEGDRVVIRWKMTGTHQGDLMGIAPTGKSVTVTGFDEFRVADGKIAELWQEVDMLGLMQQLGALPAPAAAGA